VIILVAVLVIILGGYFGVLIGYAVTGPDSDKRPFQPHLVDYDRLRRAAEWEDAHPDRIRLDDVDEPPTLLVYRGDTRFNPN